MRIYISHSKEFDFEKELYEPIRKSKLELTHEIILPHEKSDKTYNSKEFIKNTCDLVIAEVSIHSTGLGIELGWADSFNKPILAIYKKGIKPPSSVKILTKNILEYSGSEDMIKKITNFIKTLN